MWRKPRASSGPLFRKAWTCSDQSLIATIVLRLLIQMAAKGYDVIMLFGDSITQKSWGPGLNGFGQRLTGECACPIFQATSIHGATDDYARKLDVLNRGLSGYNTEWAAPIFKQVGAMHSR